MSITLSAIKADIRSIGPRGEKVIRLAVSLLGLAAIVPAQWINVQGYAVEGRVWGIAPGPDGALWFTEWNNWRIGHLTTTGTMKEFSLPNAPIQERPQAIVAGPDRAMWFTENLGNKIGRLTTTGVFTEYPLLDADSGPWDITVGPDGALWFTENNIHRIGRITTDGAISEYPLASGTYPMGIAAGPDGAVWFGEWGTGAIGRITTDGILTEYPLPTQNSGVHSIVAGPDGALWFTAWSHYWDPDSVGRITTAGAITLYPLPNATWPWGITVGSDGAVWFTESNVVKIGRITMEGVLTEYGSDSWQPWGIAAGPDGSLWFAAEGKVSRAPACGLGFSARFANGTLTMNFNLGVSTPATFNIHLRDATGPFAAPFSRAIPAVIPPRAFTMNWGDFPNKGQVTVVPQLIAGSGAGLCAEWTTVNTAH